MTRVIATGPVFTFRAIQRGDDIQVISGHHAGDIGTVICNFKGGITASRPDGSTFWTPAQDCIKKEVAGQGDLQATD